MTRFLEGLAAPSRTKGGDNRSVMPLDVRGCTRATLKASACALSVPCLKRPGNPLNRLRAWDRDLQLSPLNEEFPVGASHQLASITSLPFVHTARRYYRSNDVVRSSDWRLLGHPPHRRVEGRGCREEDQTVSFRGSKSRNKVSVGEPAEGSLPIYNAASHARSLRRDPGACLPAFRYARKPMYKARVSVILAAPGTMQVRSFPWSIRRLEKGPVALYPRPAKYQVAKGSPGPGLPPLVGGSRA